METPDTVAVAKGETATFGKRFRIAKEMNARVYPVVLPEQTLWVTNWFESKGFRLMNRNQPVEYYSVKALKVITAMSARSG